MEAVIRSLSSEAGERIDEVFGVEWRVGRNMFFEDGVKMYDVAVNLSYVTIKTDEDADGVWLCRGYDTIFRIDPTEYLAIIIR